MGYLLIFRYGALKSPFHSSHLKKVIPAAEITRKAAPPSSASEPRTQDENFPNKQLAGAHPDALRTNNF